MLIRKSLFARLYRIDAPGEEGTGLEGGDAVGSGNDARIAMLNAIGDANDADRAEELAEVHDDGTTTAFELDDATKAALATAESEANLGGEDTVEGGAEPVDTPAPAAIPEKHKLKVNGRELEFTTEELIERARKVESADDYLQQAARIKREAEARAQPNNSEAPPRETGRAEGVTPEERRALVRAIQVGTEEEAMDALEKLMPNPTAALNAGDLARTVDERLNFKEAISWFQSEFKDVLADPVLSKMARDSDATLVAQGDKRPYKERYAAIGNDLRAWVAKFKPADAAPHAPAPAPVDRNARKAAAPSTPKPANSRAPAPAAEEEGEENVSSVIAGIAKARGGPQWMRS